MQYAQQILFLGFVFCFHLIGGYVLHALRLCTGVVVTISFQQVDDAPNTETGTESDNESLKNTNSRVKKFHR